MANLRPVRTLTLKRQRAFPVEVVLHALSLYQQLITLYFDTEALRLEERTREFSEMVESRDRHSLHGCRFKSLFARISTPVPGSFQEVFGENVQLAIDCWAGLTWQEREKLGCGLLVRDIFQTLDTIKVSDCKFNWMPAPEVCPCVLVNGSFRTNVQTVLDSITSTCRSQIGYNKDSWADLAQNVQDRCWQEWERQTFPEKEQPKLPSRVKDHRLLLNGMELDNYRAFIRKDCIDSQEPASLMGGKEMLLKVLREDPYLHAPATASKLIEKVDAYISRHGPSVNTTVVPDTPVTSDVFFSSLLTLKDTAWVSTQVVDFFFVRFALCTGGCSEKFPLPLNGSDGPRVFYCDTTVWSNIIKDNKRWRFDFRNYDFLFMPAHVDGSHYIGFAITMDGDRGSLQSFDSLGSPRRSERRVVLKWLQHVAPDITWTHCKGSCPVQRNCYDCALFTILCGTYFHKVSCARTLAECYSQADIPAVRKMMVLLSIQVGNDMRSDAPWCPFSDAGTRSPTGWEARPGGGDDDWPGSPTTREPDANGPGGAGRGAPRKRGRPESPETRSRHVGHASGLCPAVAGWRLQTTTAGWRPQISQRPRPICTLSLLCP